MGMTNDNKAQDGLKIKLVTPESYAASDGKRRRTPHSEVDTDDDVTGGISKKIKADTTSPLSPEQSIHTSDSTSHDPASHQEDSPQATATAPGSSDLPQPTAVDKQPETLTTTQRRKKDEEDDNKLWTVDQYTALCGFLVNDRQSRERESCRELNDYFYKLLREELVEEFPELEDTLTPDSATKTIKRQLVILSKMTEALDIIEGINGLGYDDRGAIIYRKGFSKKIIDRKIAEACKARETLSENFITMMINKGWNYNFLKRTRYRDLFYVAPYTDVILKETLAVRRRYCEAFEENKRRSKMRSDGNEAGNAFAKVLADKTFSLKGDAIQGFTKLQREVEMTPEESESIKDMVYSDSCDSIAVMMLTRFLSRGEPEMTFTALKQLVKFRNLVTTKAAT